MLAKQYVVPFPTITHKTVISEREYKPLNKSGPNTGRCCQWEVMDRNKIAIKEATDITNIIKEFSEIRGRGRYLSLKECIKSQVIKARRPKKTVKWATNVEVFEERYVDDKQKQILWNYRMISNRTTTKIGESNQCGILNLQTTEIAISSSTCSLSRTSISSTFCI